MENRQIGISNFNNWENKTKYTPAKGIYVFPFTIVSGCVNMTENGLISEEYEDLVTYVTKIFSGKEAIRVVWDDSTTLSNYSENNNYFQYDFDVGTYYIGKVLDSGTQSVEISDVAGNESFLSMKSAQSVTLMFEFKPSDMVVDNNDNNYSLFCKDQDKWKLYQIPEIGQNKWFYISNCEYVYDNKTNKIKGNVITFKSLVDELQVSGRAVEQYIHINAPGEPYAYPKIEYDSAGNKSVVLDKYCSEWNINNLVKYFQIEFQGTAAVSSVMIIGRKLKYNAEKKKWYSSTPGFLFPYIFLKDMNLNDLNKTSVPSTTFFYFPHTKLAMNFTKEWAEQIKAYSGNNMIYSNAGKINLGSTNDWNGEYIHKSNPDLIDFYDSDWKPISFTSSYTRKTTGDYAQENLKYFQDDSFKNLFVKNGFVNKNLMVLPTNFRTTIPFRIKDIPIIGNVIPYKWGSQVWSYFSNVYDLSTSGVDTFIDSTFATTLKNIAINTDSEVTSFLNAFGGDTIPAGFGSTNYNTTLFYELTNMLKFAGTNKETIESDCLGQTVDMEGEDIMKDKSTCLLPGQFELVHDFKGYVIDKVMINAIYAGNIRITTYDLNKNSNYATTICSTAKWLDNAYNNWFTEVTLGTWNQEYLAPDYNPKWPEQIKQKIENSVAINKKYNFPTLTTYTSISKDNFDSVEKYRKLCKYDINYLIYSPFKYEWGKNYGTALEYAPNYAYIGVLDRTYSTNNQTDSWNKKIVVSDKFDSIPYPGSITKSEFFKQYKQLVFDLSGTGASLYIGDYQSKNINVKSEETKTIDIKEEGNSFELYTVFHDGILSTPDSKAYSVDDNVIDEYFGLKLIAGNFSDINGHKYLWASYQSYYNTYSSPIYSNTVVVKVTYNDYDMSIEFEHTAFLGIDVLGLGYKLIEAMKKDGHSNPFAFIGTTSLLKNLGANQTIYNKLSMDTYINSVGFIKNEETK